jgi:DNA-binding transcriptional LysR family regulator
VINLNDLRVFERVAVLANFSAAGRVLGIPKSTVSRCVIRLETELGVRLIQRTTHNVRLTEPGLALKRRCLEVFAHLNQAIDDVSSLSALPKGTLKINATIGFGYSVLSETLPTFLERYPDIDVSLELTSH